MKNLNELGVQEMNAKELKKTDGGTIALSKTLLDVAIWALGEYDDIRRGCEDALKEWDTSNY